VRLPLNRCRTYRRSVLRMCSFLRMFMETRLALELLLQLLLLLRRRQ